MEPTTLEVAGEPAIRKRQNAPLFDFARSHLREDNLLQILIGTSWALIFAEGVSIY